MTNYPKFHIFSQRDIVLIVEGLQHYYICYFAHIARVPSVCAYLIDNLELQPQFSRAQPVGIEKPELHLRRPYSFLAMKYAKQIIHLPDTIHATDYLITSLLRIAHPVLDTHPYSTLGCDNPASAPKSYSVTLRALISTSSEAPSPSSLRDLLRPTTD